MNYTPGSTIKVRLNVKVKADGTETKGIIRLLVVRSHSGSLIVGDIKVHGATQTVEVDESRVIAALSRVIVTDPTGSVPADPDTDDRPVLASIPLTPFQREEVEHGLFIDDTDNDNDTPLWGRVRVTGRTTAWLDVLDWNGAVYRMSSGRDIFRDNASDDMLDGAEHRAAAAGARSLTSLIVRMVDIAGGPDVLDHNTRRWLNPGDWTAVERVPAVEVVPAPSTRPVDLRKREVLSERRFIGRTAGLHGPMQITVRVVRVDGCKATADGWHRASYFVLDHNDRQLFGGVADHLPENGIPRDVHGVEVERVALDPNPVPVLDVDTAASLIVAATGADIDPDDIAADLSSGSSFSVHGHGRIYRPNPDGTVSVYVDLSKTIR